MAWHRIRKLDRMEQWMDSFISCIYDMNYRKRIDYALAEKIAKTGLSPRDGAERYIASVEAV